jgi:phage baseplate assembly protein W
MATVTTTMDSTRTFRDLDLNFEIHPIRKDINVHKNEYAIINSVKNLILTNHYERPFQPELGSNLRKLLFENIDTVVAAQIEREIEETIRNFEPRVQVSRTTAIPTPDENKYKVELEFFVINNPNPITINFFLERVR